MWKNVFLSCGAGWIGQAVKKKKVVHPFIFCYFSLLSGLFPLTRKRGHKGPWKHHLQIGAFTTSL